MDNTVIINGIAYTGVKTIVVTTAEGKQVQYFTDSVRTINGIAPDENGNVVIEAGVNDAELTAAVEAALQEAKDSGEFDGAPGAPGEPGQDYVLTDDDKNEIVLILRESVNPVLTVNNTEPDENGNVTVTVGVDADELNAAVEAALEEARTSGKFVLTINGTAPDANGNVNVETGTNYNLTDADKAEISTKVLEALPTWSGGDY